MKLLHVRTYQKVAHNMSDSQIGAQKRKSVRNHLFVLNSIISDVLSSKQKAPIDLNIMDYKQMFDAEEVPICLNALYDAGVNDDIYALICEANSSATFAIKTPNGITKKTTIINKIMQGDVLSPLVSSNMVDHYIGKKALATGQIYLYKNKVVIPPLAMQDDTLGISECGVKTTKMNQFLNTQTNLMNLQFGNDKCVQMHIGKKHHVNVCSGISVESWKENVIENEEGKKVIQDVHMGKELMKNVSEKKYLGDIVSCDGRNTKNIVERTNRANGNIDKIISTLTERPFGRHYFKAYKLMREGMLIGGLLTNSESWINIINKDIDCLEKPDTILQRKVVSSMGNPCKAFMMLELGIIPVRYILIQKRMQFLHYILGESTDAMLRKVFEAQKQESKKGDFVALTNKDKVALGISLSDQEIQQMSKWKWKKIVKENTKIAALRYLNNENSKRNKTKDIVFRDLKMCEYLKQNQRTSLSKFIFCIRSKSLDIKEWQSWKYEDEWCVMCLQYPETMDHFSVCKEYGDVLELSWTEINGENTSKQIEIGIFLEKRYKMRQKLIAQQEDGQASHSGSTAPGTSVELVLE